MTDNEATDSAEEVQEQAAPPAPQVAEVSPAGDSAPSAVTEDTLTEMFSKFREGLVEELRVTQSNKDKRFDRIEKDIAGLRSIKERLDANDGDWSALEREAVENEYLSRLSDLEAKLSAQDGGSSVTQEWEVGISKVRKNAEEKYNVSLSNDEIAQITEGKTYASYSDAFADITDAFLAKATGNSLPQAAVATGGGGQTAPPPGDVDTLTEQLKGLIADQAPLADIKAKQAELQQALG
jgi:hypothetical protein